MTNTNLIETFGKTTSDFPETSYWYRSARLNQRNKYHKLGEYLTDINNPIGKYRHTDEPIRVYPESNFLNESWETFSKLTDGPQQRAINVSNPWDVISVISINKITERDYVIQFTLASDNNTIYPYVVRDCNHYNHAYNRFAKRVREQVNVRLGLNLAVKDARPTEEELRKQEEAAERQRLVQEALTKVEQIASSVPVYNLFLSINMSGAIEVCGDSDVLGLIRKAQEIVQAFDLATPNVEVQIRDRNGNIVVLVTQDEVRIL